MQENWGKILFETIGFNTIVIAWHCSLKNTSATIVNQQIL
jgi:hypothetical protein